jgi:hypothetical protein
MYSKTRVTASTLRPAGNAFVTMAVVMPLAQGRTTHPALAPVPRNIGRLEITVGNGKIHTHASLSGLS